MYMRKTRIGKRITVRPRPLDVASCHVYCCHLEGIGGASRREGITRPNVLASPNRFHAAVSRKKDLVTYY